MQKHQRIHIIPIGYDFTRATEPLIKDNSDRVYFIRHIIDDRGHDKFYNEIKKELNKKLKKIQIKDQTVDLWDLYDCVEKFRKIIQFEKDNHVSINLSTGTKVTAMAGMLSCMLFGAIPYYVRLVDPLKKNVVSIPRDKVKDPIELPTYTINSPTDEQMKVLKVLKDNKKPMRKKTLSERLVQLGIIRLKSEEATKLTIHAKLAQLQTILEPLEKYWGFIGVNSYGRRSDVYLKEHGEQALKIFGVE